MKTVTEKYHAVNEGAMSKAEFVRQMRLAHPQLISQFNGFNDSVQILKNKGLLFEKKEENEYENPSYNLSPDAVRRGLRYELLLAGLDPAGDISEEDYTKAHKKAQDNIMKDQLHYYRMIADDKTKIEHDKMKETKRGAQETDTDNAMAKVKLNENVNKKQLIRESVESCVAAIRNKYPNDGDAMIKAFIKMHKNDIAGKTPKQCVAEYEEYRTANLDSLDETESAINETRGDLTDLIRIVDDRIRNSDFGREVEIQEVIENLANYYGYDVVLTEKPDKETDELNENQTYTDYDDIIEVIKYKTLQGSGSEQTEALKATEFVARHYFNDDIVEFLEQFTQELGIDIEFEAGPSRQAEGKKNEELKGGQHKLDVNKNGKIDASDFASLRKDVNEAEEKIKRALKKKIVQILNEGSLNEAATNQLADLANQYAGFDGMKGAILDLQNIVTDIESYYDKTRGKIQRVYDTLGEIRNEEGLKVGAFIAPAVESAFNKDLRPVVKDGFTKGLDTPKVRTLSQADIDAAGGGDLEEKQTVFNENKKTK